VTDYRDNIPKGFRYPWPAAEGPEPTRAKGCTCVRPSEYDDRHELGCALTTDLETWLFYDHDGELENGGVYVHPTDRSLIYLLVKGYLIPVPLSEDDAET
jgi:hypothetical protein